MPIDIPVESMPHWERRYPGRLRYELDALQSAGIVPEVDSDALRARQIALTFDWPLDAGPILRLKAVYPDSFPHIRPQVFLLSGINPVPARHVSPIDGNLCLLGRDSRQWMPSWTLHKLLAQQLESSVLGTGEEDPQGEPAEYWWNSLNRSGSFCLIDSNWDLGEAREGMLLLRYVRDGVHTEKHGGVTIRVPVIRAFVSEVYDKDKKVLHRWDGPLPPDLVLTKLKLRIPWVRSDETILPESNLLNQLGELRRNHAWLQRSKPQFYQPGITIDLVAVVHRSELSFDQFGVGWILFFLFGDPQAFSIKTAGKKRKKPIHVTALPIYRAGADDIGHRVPAVEMLRQKRVLIVGTGAIGAPVAIELARNGCGTLQLIEHDTVEPGNTVRWPLGASAWGRYKLDALQAFLAREYPGTHVEPHKYCLGQAAPTVGGRGDDEVLDTTIGDVDLVIDGSASHGVTTLLADRCREAGVPFISLFATPTLDGGAVVRHVGGGGCPNCLEYAWHNNEIPPPPGRGSEDGLTQPPGCSERTFIGAGYDLQELSLQAVRLAVETLSGEAADSSVVQTLSFVDDGGHRCAPRWRTDPLPQHPSCRCQGPTLHESPETTVGSESLIVWMPQSVIQNCFDEASDKFPLEAGGTFMGRWADGHTAVITAMIGSGPNAYHGRHSFQPDEAWQLNEIARHYKESGRRETYIGDWHSHPGASGGTLSWIDRRVLRSVITSPSARCPNPLMIVFWGQSHDWQLTAWRGHLRRRHILWSRLILERASMKFFASK